MVEWLFPPHSPIRINVPTDEIIRIVLDELLTTISPDDFQQVVQKRQQMLFSERVLLIFCLTGAQEYIRGNIEQANTLQDICSPIIEDRIQKGYSDNLSVPEMEATDEARLRQHIELLTHALTSTGQSHNPSLWAELQRERADDYLNLADLSEPLENIERAITNYDAALTLLTSDGEPFAWAKAHMLRGLAYLERQAGEQRSNIEKAIADFTASLLVYTDEDNPVEWAVTHVERGIGYRYRTTGDAEENLKLALADFDTALEGKSREDMPVEWAKTYLYKIDTYMQMNDGVALTEKNERAYNDYTHLLENVTFEDMPDQWLEAHYKRGNLYLENPQGYITFYRERAMADFNACLEKPLLTTHPTIWAYVHRLRGIAYVDYPADDLRKNATLAIADFNAALEVFTREDMPLDWARTILNRASVYRERSYVTRAEDIERAIVDYDATLEIFAKEDTPEEWAVAHMDRGLSYMNRMYGNPVENAERAIADFNTVLAVCTRENDPAMYALAQLNMGCMYLQRNGEKRTEDMRYAITCFNTALELFTPEEDPRRWGLAHMNRGFAYTELPVGEKRANLERAMRDCDAALTVFTRETAPIDWALTTLNRTHAYSILMADYHEENLEESIKDYCAVLEVLTREATPRYWAAALINRGYAYLDRIYGSKSENLELAISDFDAALTVAKPETMLSDWAMALLNRGLACTWRVQGDPADNIDEAIANFNTVLRRLSREQMPHLRAMVCKNRGIAYYNRIHGNPAKNYQHAIADGESALTVWTREGDPREYRDVQLLLALVYEKQERWPDACRALQEARQTMQLLLDTASDEERRREVIGERNRSTVHLRYAQALLHCNPPNVIAALCALDEGRAQNSGVALELDKIMPEKMSDPAARKRAEAFVAARDTWREALHLTTDTAFINLGADERNAESARLRPRVNAAYRAFIEARDAIRQFDDPHFLQSHVTFNDIGEAIPNAGDALVYLAAGEDSGLAMVVLRTSGNARRVQHFILPKLTRVALFNLLLGEEKMPPMRLMQVIGGMEEVPLLSGGLWMAQWGQSFELLTMWGDNIHAAMQHLPAESTFWEAAQQLIEENRDGEAQQDFINQPFDTFTVDERMALGAVFSNLVINAELKRSLRVPGKLGFNDVVQYLSTWGARNVTLITYGHWSLFPLHAAIVELPGKGEHYLSNLFTVTIAPGARAKAMALSRASSLDRAARPLLLTVGNPSPRPYGVSSLPYSQAEADTIQRIAKAYQVPSETTSYLRLREVSKERVVKGLEKAWYAHLAIHGQYNKAVPRQSRLILAGTESLRREQGNLYLSEALDGNIHLDGLRLLVLSACETGLIDLEIAPDEVLGLAAGFLQAGAAGVIASLWAVDDHATFLLMSRFAQLYLDPSLNWSPARALAEAQRWLREEATNAILITYDPVQEIVERVTRQTATSSQQATIPPADSIEAFVTSGLRSLRYTYQSGFTNVHLQALLRSMEEPEALPYADPIYWAGFVVTGC